MWQHCVREYVSVSVCEWVCGLLLDISSETPVVIPEPVVVFGNHISKQNHMFTLTWYNPKCILQVKCDYHKCWIKQLSAEAYSQSVVAYMSHLVEITIYTVRRFFSILYYYYTEAATESFWYLWFCYWTEQLYGTIWFTFIFHVFISEMYT